MSIEKELNGNLMSRLSMALDRQLDGAESNLKLAHAAIYGDEPDWSEVLEWLKITQMCLNQAQENARKLKGVEHE